MRRIREELPTDQRELVRAYPSRIDDRIVAAALVAAALPRASPGLNPTQHGNLVVRQTAGGQGHGVAADRIREHVCKEGCPSS